MGRHSMYTAEIAEAICERLAAGQPLEAICRDEGMPAASTVHDWCSDVYRPKDVPDAFPVAIARARACGEDAIAAECLLIADDARNDWMERQAQEEGATPTVAFNAEHVQRSKLRIDTRLKLLAKWNPKKWGDKVSLDVEANVKGSVSYQANIPPRKDD